jgi:hypothetical protein
VTTSTPEATSPTSADETTPTSGDDGSPAADRPASEIVSVEERDGRYVIEYRAQNFLPDIDEVSSFHVHFFWDDLEPINAGSNGPNPGQWLVWDTPTTVDNPFFDVAGRPPTAGAICALVATVTHEVADVDGDGTVDTDTGNCVDLPA